MSLLGTELRESSPLRKPYIPPPPAPTLHQFHPYLNQRFTKIIEAHPLLTMSILSCAVANIAFQSLLWSLPCSSNYQSLPSLSSINPIIACALPSETTVYLLANLALFSFSMGFFNAAYNDRDLTIHLIKRKKTVSSSLYNKRLFPTIARDLYPKISKNPPKKQRKETVLRPSQSEKIALVQCWDRIQTKAFIFFGIIFAEDKTNSSEAFLKESSGIFEIPSINDYGSIKSCMKDTKNLKKVRALDLANLTLETIPLDLARFTGLQKVSFYNNRIQNISSLQYLFNLTTLDLSNNEISKIPYKVDQKGRKNWIFKSLKNLTTLNLSHNKISSLSGLVDQSRIIVLDLSHNQIREMTPALRLANLARLTISDNPITDWDTFYEAHREKPTIFVELSSFSIAMAP